MDAAGLVIFLLLLYFFRNIKLVMAPMLLAIVTVIWSMGALIYSGESIHIMSSMIPIFLMPIAVLNSIHILSSLHKQINDFNTREEAVRAVMFRLFNPMAFTSLTTVVGFASLATTGIPPVIVFGIAIAFGVALAWLLSILFIPAYFMLLPDGSIKNFGKHEDDSKSVIMEIVYIFKGIARSAPRAVILATVVTLVISYAGLQQIVINDNPVRWFKADHFLRKADHVMNKKLAGTYLAHLYFSFPETEPITDAVPAVKNENSMSDTFAGDEFEDAGFGEDAFGNSGFEEMEDTTVPTPSIKDPVVINYMNDVTQYIKTLRDEDKEPIVGGVTSIVDILRKVGEVALQDDSLPSTREQVSQYMFLFESGDPNKGKDMWKFITPGESKSAQMWLQLKSGDNQKMSTIMAALDEYMKEHPAPAVIDENGRAVQLKVEWTGLTHINNVWQEEMVEGMMMSLLGSFLTVFIMMVLLFRSWQWGLVAMLPLTLTIMMIYGVIGFTGKYYDMPIAVLSSLTLGLSIDFAIHFIESTRTIFKEQNFLGRTIQELFQTTAHAIWRNVLVVSVGFIPLFFANLVPYMTVGSFFFGIMLVSGITTLILLPAILIKFHKWLPDLQHAPPLRIESLQKQMAICTLERKAIQEREDKLRLALIKEGYDPEKILAAG